jgi:hypothetical protein
MDCQRMNVAKRPLLPNGMVVPEDGASQEFLLQRFGMSSFLAKKLDNSLDISRGDEADLAIM